MSEIDETFTIIKGVHFTPPALVEYLNKHYGSLLAMQRGNKRAYNINDIHQYILRERLPIYFKKNTLKEIYVPQLGGKILELIWL